MQNRADFYLWFAPNECVRPRAAILTETIDLYAEGMSISDLADLFDVSGTTIRARIECAKRMADRRHISLPGIAP